MCDLFLFPFLGIPVDLDADLPGKEEIDKGGVCLWGFRYAILFKVIFEPVRQLPNKWNDSKRKWQKLWIWVYGRILWGECYWKGLFGKNVGAFMHSSQYSLSPPSRKMDVCIYQLQHPCPRSISGYKQKLERNALVVPNVVLSLQASCLSLIINWRALSFIKVTAHKETQVSFGSIQKSSVCFVCPQLGTLKTHNEF